MRGTSGRQLARARARPPESAWASPRGDAHIARIAPWRACARVRLCADQMQHMKLGWYHSGRARASTKARPSTCAAERAGTIVRARALTSARASGESMRCRCACVRACACARARVCARSPQTSGAPSLSKPSVGGGVHTTGSASALLFLAGFSGFSGFSGTGSGTTASSSASSTPSPAWGGTYKRPQLRLTSEAQHAEANRKRGKNSKKATKCMPTKQHSSLSSTA
eukprot:6193217-Pleurochrysis_carterae.AAC.1